MEKRNVIVTATKEGKVFTQSANADGSPKLDKNGKPFGYIRVENPSTIDMAFAYNTGGVKRGQSALIGMTLEAWDVAKKHIKDGTEIPGNVRVVESLQNGPGFKAKIAGTNGTPCLLDGQQIYRKTEFDPTGELADELIAHNNEIKGSSVVLSAEALNAKK